MKSIRHLTSALILFLLLFGLAAGEEPPGPPAVEIDYVPTFVYDDEDARIHARVLNKKPSESFELSIEVRDGEGKVMETVGSKDLGSSVRFIIPKALLDRASSLYLVADRGGRTEKVTTLVVLKAWEKLPPLRVTEGRLETKGGEAVIILVKHVEEKGSRKWFLIKKISEWFKGHQPPEKVVLLCDLPKLKNDPDRFCISTLASVSGELDLAKDAAVLLMLGNEDVRAGNDKVVFRRSVEATVQQLRARGFERVRLATPVASPFHAARLAAYEKVVRKVSRAFRLEKAIDSSQYLSGNAWNADDRGETLLARLPAEASEKLSKDLLEAWR